MNREETIRALQKIGNSLAIYYNFNTVDVKEDREKGVWGEVLTEYLESNYGPCTEEITWHNGNPRESCLGFRFRFSSPCLSIRLPNGVFCEIQLSDFDSKTEKRTGNFDVAEIIIWKREGMKLADLLMKYWDEAIQCEESIEPDTNDPSQYPACLDDYSDYSI